MRLPRRIAIGCCEVSAHNERSPEAVIARRAILERRRSAPAVTTAATNTNENGNLIWQWEPGVFNTKCQNPNTVTAASARSRTALTTAASSAARAALTVVVILSGIPTFRARTAGASERSRAAVTACSAAADLNDTVFKRRHCSRDNERNATATRLRTRTRPTAASTCAAAE